MTRRLSPEKRFFELWCDEPGRVRAFARNLARRLNEADRTAAGYPLPQNGRAGRGKNRSLADEARI